MADWAGIFDAGTATVAAGGTTVTFQNAGNLSQAVRSGDRFGAHRGLGIRIASIAGNVVTLAAPWPGPAQSAQPYEIAFTPYDGGYREALQKLLETFGVSGNVLALAALSGEVDKLPIFTGAGAMALVDIDDIKGDVASVNGQIGEIVLEADDVGALPSDTTAIDIGGLGTEFKRSPTAFARPYLMKVAERLTVKDYGALGDGTDEGTKLQAAVSAAVAENKTLIIPTAEATWGYTTSKTLDVDFSATSRIIDRKRPFLRGESAGNSIISYTGTGSAVRFKGSDGVNKPYPDGHHALTGMSDLTILGPGISGNTRGIDVENCAYLDFQRLEVQSFAFGLYAAGLEFTKFTRCNFKRNGYGAKAQIGPGNSSHPNGNTFDTCDISINEYGGLDWIGGSALNFFNTDVQYNGFSTLIGQVDRFGVRITNAGYQGGVGLSVFGGYFEHNAGIGDFYLRQLSTAVPTVNHCLYNFTGASFNRVTSSGVSFAPGPHNIFASFHANGGTQKVSVTSCSFKHYNQYVPNGANKYILFDPAGQPMNAQSYRGIGNLFMSSLEAPALADIA
jgi:hypothetical protein